MDRQAAVKIIKDTFESPFDKGRFINLTKNLVKYLDGSRNFTYQGNIIPDAYEQSIQTLERIGQYEDAEDKKMDVLIVRLKKEQSLERARTMQRNFVAWYLNGSRGGELKDAALVAFVSPESQDWRFSLVRMDYNIAQSPGGRIKVEKELTPARRYSFLVGENESSHTAQVQLLPILQDDERKPLLSDFEKAFNIEVVTREFFTKYRDLFNDVKEELEGTIAHSSKVKGDFEAKGIDPVNFAKKLLGQIVFLYFLQKKGWFGVGRDADWGTGPKDFLRRLFEKKIASYGNFFNDVLEPLFYEALAVERTDDFYSRFNCKIPFLNGGLFDPINNYDWVHTDILLPNKLFSNSAPTKEGDTGTGILDVFDRYNFTVKEDEPLDKEVAVDPEMLGKVFENLLEVKDRKSKGTYYTPREIVHYMCQESLINYLDTALNSGEVPLVKEKPTNLKLFGAPASQQQALKSPGNVNRVPREDIEAFVHRGELAIEHDARVESTGRETRDYSYKLPPSIRLNAAIIDDRLAAIRVCDPAIGSGAFPVGLMTEIVRARNTLTTYLPDKTGRTNYNFKRHAIQNCLYGVDIDPGAVEIAKLRLWLSLVVDEEDIQQIQPLPNLDYKIVCGNSLLGVEKNLFNVELFNQLEKLKPLYFDETNAKKKHGFRNQIDQLIKNLTNNKEIFDFEVYFSEVFHEKGGFDVVIANPPYGANIDDRVELYAKLYPNTTKYHKDIYKMFIEKAIVSLLCNYGVLTYIVPNTLLIQPRYRDARAFLLTYRVIVVMNLGEQVFEVGIVPTCIIMVQKMKTSGKVKFADLSVNSKYGGDISKISCESIEQKEYQDSRNNVFVSQSRKLQGDEENLGAILQLKDAGINYQRVRVGLSQKGNSDLGQRLLYEGERESSQDIQFWKGSDIDAYFCKSETNRFVRIGTTRTLKPNERVILSEDYFSITPKIIWRQTASYPIATLDERGIWFGRSVQGGVFRQGKSKQYSYKYVLALLNSSYLRSLYAHDVKETGRVFPQVKLVNLATLPIRRISVEAQKPIIKLVDLILGITKDKDYISNQTKQTRVKELEHSIDQMVYELYGLSPVEIAVVEGKR